MRGGDAWGDPWRVGRWGGEAKQSQSSSEVKGRQWNRIIEILIAVTVFHMFRIRGNTEHKSYKKTRTAHGEMKTTVSEMKTTWGGVDGRPDTTEVKGSEVKTLQWQLPKLKQCI